MHTYIHTYIHIYTHAFIDENEIYLQTLLTVNW